MVGVTGGCYVYILPIYVGEISSKEIRGSLLSLFSFSLNIGVLLVYTVGHFASLLVLNIVCGVIPLVYSIGFLALPESPYFLITHNRDDDARRSLQTLRGASYDVNTELNVLKKQNEALKAENKTWAEIFKTKSTVKAFIVVLLQFLFFQMSGISVVMFYSQKIFIEAGIGIEPGIASIMVASMQLAATTLAVLLVHRIGRKTMLYYSNTILFIALIGIGTFFALSEDFRNVDNLRWLPIASLCVFAFAFYTGVGPVRYVEVSQFACHVKTINNLLATFSSESFSCKMQKLLLHRFAKCGISS